MSEKGELRSIHCAQCRIKTEAAVETVVDGEVVAVRCELCGTVQPPRLAPRRGRRVVDMAPEGRSSRSPRRKGAGSLSEGSSPPVMPVADAGAAPEPTPSPYGAGPLFEEWDRATVNVRSRDARPHREKDRYQVGEMIVHSRFGMGRIEKVAKDGSLTVLFKAGYESLASGRSSNDTHLRPDRE